MIQGPNSKGDPDLPHLRCLANDQLRRWAGAAAEDENLLADILGPEDSASNRYWLAKIFTNLGRFQPPTP